MTDTQQAIVDQLRKRPSPSEDYTRAVRMFANPHSPNRMSAFLFLWRLQHGVIKGGQG